jgi:hypothetical protein
MQLKINKWFGRLGNNIIQIKNAIQIALYYNYKTITIPYSVFFNTTIINISDENNETIITDKNNETNINNNETIITDKNNETNINNNETIITDKNNFFYETTIKNINIELFIFNIDKTILILKKIFEIKGKLELNDNDIVIHIRSGDIFTNNPHPLYIMPPLSYYTSILNNNNFNKIYLIAEDTFNPVTHKLIQLYPNIVFKLRNIQNDIELLLSCNNVIESFGSFTKCLLLLSENVENVYKPSYQSTFLIESKKYNNKIIKINDIDLDDYRKKMFPWKHTKEQLNLMINYNI